MDSSEQLQPIAISTLRQTTGRSCVLEGALISYDFRTPNVSPLRREINSSLELKSCLLSRMIMEEPMTAVLEGINVSGKSLCC